MAPCSKPGISRRLHHRPPSQDATATIPNSTTQVSPAFIAVAMRGVAHCRDGAKPGDAMKSLQAMLRWLEAQRHQTGRTIGHRPIGAAACEGSTS